MGRLAAQFAVVTSGGRAALLLLSRSARGTPAGAFGHSAPLRALVSAGDACVRAAMCDIACAVDAGCVCRSLSN